MKSLRIAILAWTLMGSVLTSRAQTMNWSRIDSTKQIATAGIGWDYGLNYSLGYVYKLDTKMPLVLNAHFSIPSGGTLLDDFKAKLGGQILLLNTSNWKGSVAVNGLFRRYENPLVRLQNFGAEAKGTVGYYRRSWFAGVEFGFDKAIVTHFKHSDIFRQHAYPDVADGWYQPATGGNFSYGVQTGYSFKRSDITFNIGWVSTEDFRSSPLIPYYLMLGYNYRIE